MKYLKTRIAEAEIKNRITKENHRKEYSNINNENIINLFNNKIDNIQNNLEKLMQIL